MRGFECYAECAVRRRERGVSMMNRAEKAVYQREQGERVARFLREHTISQRDAAARVGWSEQVMSRFLKGGRTLYADDLVKFRDALGIDAEFLVNGKGS